MHPLDAVQTLRSAGGALWVQAVLHGQLAQVEWEQEKQRLIQMLVIALLGFTFFLCAMLSVSGLVLAATWDTAYRLPAVLVLLLVHGLAAAATWRRFRAHSARGGQVFTDSLAEFAADAALLRKSA